MSLVGTRPPTVDEWKQYEPYHRGRLAVKPGLTGMWQVSGRSDITDFEEVVKLDMDTVGITGKRYAYGFTHPNVLGAVLLVIVICWCYLHWKSIKLS